MMRKSAESKTKRNLTPAESPTVSTSWAVPGDLISTSQEGKSDVKEDTEMGK